MKFFMLKSDRGFYKRRAQWVQNAQDASVWTSEAGAISAKGSAPFASNMQIVELEGNFKDPSFATTAAAA